MTKKEKKIENERGELLAHKLAGAGWVPAAQLRTAPKRRLVALDSAAAAHFQVPTTPPPQLERSRRKSKRALYLALPDGRPREGGGAGGAGGRDVADLRGVRRPVHGAQPPRRPNGAHRVMAGLRGLDKSRPRRPPPP